MLWLLQQQIDLKALSIHIFMPPIKANDTPYPYVLPRAFGQKRCDPFHSNDLEDLKLPWGRGKESPNTHKR
jgi:hypothetical protein